jgi:predicted membrane channel-forming protein YqfA (hemolysin III family)
MRRMEEKIMNGLIFPILVVILLILGITVLVAAVVWRKRKEGEPREVDYRVFFILGICFFPLGVTFMIQSNPMGFVFFIMGFVYLVIGLANRDKWKRE